MKKRRKIRESGIALAFSLVLLSLLLVIGVSFILLSSNDRVSSGALTTARIAKLLADTGVNRAKAHLLHELNQRTNTSADYVAEIYYSVTTPEELKARVVKDNTARTEDLDRLLLSGAVAQGVQWNYITSPDLPGTASHTREQDDRRVVGRFAYLAFAGSKISPEATLDSEWKPENPPPRAGYTTRELRPEAAFLSDEASILTKLTPGTSAYISAEENHTGSWPDLTTVAKTLGYKTGRQLSDVYKNFAVGKLPSPEMWRMSMHAEFPYRAMHRFNLFKTPYEWRDFKVEESVALTPEDYAWAGDNGKTSNNYIADEKIGLYFFNAGRANGDLPPGFTEVTMRKQMLANLKDYNDYDFVSTTNIGEDLNISTLKEIEYAGIERAPYFTNVLLAFSYVVEPIGDQSYDVTFSLDNFACEMHNMYENPDLYIENVKLLFDLDVRGETNLGEQLYFEIKGKVMTDMNISEPSSGLGEKVFKGRWPDYTGSFTTSEGRRQPYFIVSAKRGLGEFEDAHVVRASQRPNLKRMIYKRVTATIAGDIEYTDEDGNRVKKKNQIFNVARCTVAGNEYVDAKLDPGGGTMTGDPANEKQSRATIAFSNDDVRPQVVPLKVGANWSTDRNFYWEISRRTIGNWMTVCANGLCALVKPEKYKQETINGFYDPEPEAYGKNGLYSVGHHAWVSTAFIRNAPMISPWELGFIHRIRCYQTLNLKKYNAESPDYMDMSDEGYRKGDAAILDQVKFTKDYVSYGKININTASEEVLRSLVKGMKYGARPAKYHQGYKPNIQAPQFPGETFPRVEGVIVTEKDPVVYEKNILEGGRELDVDAFKGALADYATAKVKGVDGEERLAQWWSRARIVNVLEPYLKDIYGINNYYDIPDADYEELIGKFVGLLEAEAAREVTVVVVAQAIQDARNSSGEYGTYESGVDRIVGEAKVLATFEYWPKLTPVNEGENMLDEHRRSDWVLTKIIYLDPASGGFE